MQKKFPVADMHCDLLSYLLKPIDADVLNKDDIGCNLPALAEGNVKLQVMAIYTSTEKGSTALALKQSQFFSDLLTKYNDRVSFFKNAGDLNNGSQRTGIVAAIENASGFCEEDEPLDSGFKKLETIISNTEKIIYIGLTHHGENRFGGGNATKAGLKEDGKTLLDYLSGKKIALDLSHTSDALAYGILDHISAAGLDISLIASHSNFRAVFEHARNLPDEIAKEIIRRKGLIGINFLRAFLNNTDPNAIYDHILYGISLGGENAICFGADYFYTNSHPDQSRKPFFYKEQENASCYPSLLAKLSEKISPLQLENIAYKNVAGFIERLWS